MCPRADMKFSSQVDLKLTHNERTYEYSLKAASFLANVSMENYGHRT